MTRLTETDREIIRLRNRRWKRERIAEHLGLTFYELTYRLGVLMRDGHIQSRTPHRNPRGGQRKCLTCGNLFMAGPLMHICRPCKNKVAWRLGNDYAMVR